jgi:hypothetical protein
MYCVYQSGRPVFAAVDVVLAGNGVGFVMPFR